MAGDTVSRLPVYPLERRSDGGGNWGPPWPASGDWLAPYSTALQGSEQLATVVACINAIAGGIASLPVVLFRREGKRRVEVTDHYLCDLFRAPNTLMGWPSFVEWLLQSTLLFGNGLALLPYDSRGRIMSFNPCPWWTANPQLIWVQEDQSLGPLAPTSAIVFRPTRTLVPWGGEGIPADGSGNSKTWTADNVIWLRDRTDSGILGRSRLARAGLAFDGAVAAQMFATLMYQNQGTPQLALKHPGQLSAEAAQRISQSWQDVHTGPINARKGPVVLEEGIGVETLSLSADDAQLLEARKFSAEEIARIFDCPPPIVGIWEHSTFNNASTAAEWFGSRTLLPWVRKIESEFQRTVLRDSSLELRIDLGGLLRGNYLDRVQGNVSLVRSGIITPNEARAAEGLDPMDGGDTLQPQAVGGKPANQADGQDALPPRPNGAGNGLDAAA